MSAPLERRAPDDLAAPALPGSIDPFAGGGEMAAIMRSVDWTRTPLGPVSSWPQSLRTALSILLETGFPMYVAWGAGFTQFYNDGYRPILGSKKHPAAMGISTRETFADIWDTIGPMFEGVMRGTATTVVDFLLPLDRHGFVEECYFIFSYSPIRAESGEVGGVLVTVMETSERVIGARRLEALEALSSRAHEARTAQAACAIAARVLGAARADLPFVLVYLLDRDGTTARLASAAGLARGTPASPEVVDLEDGDGPWSLGVVARAGAAQLVDARGIDPGPASAAEDRYPSERALVLPIVQPGNARPAGFLVAGLSARLVLDERYRSFIELAARHLGTAIASARAHEEAQQRAGERLEAERGRQRLYSQLMQAPVAVSIVHGPELVFDLANPRYEQMVGRPVAVGRTLRQVFPELAPDAPLILVLTAVIITGKPFIADEYCVPLDRKGDGVVEDTYFKFTAQPMRDAAGEVSSIMIVAVDVTEQVRARRAVEASQTLLATVMNQIPAGVLVVEAPSGRLMLSNARVRAILGREPVSIRSIADNSAYPMVHADGRRVTSDSYVVARALRGETILDEELILAPGDGPRQTLSASGVPVRDADDRIIAAVITFSDITDRKQAEEQRRQLLLREQQARADAEVANRSKDQFLAMLGHELRNPIAPILTALELMRDSGNPSTEMTQVIERQVAHLVRLIDDLLDVSRIARGGVELRRSVVEIAEIITRAVEMASPLLERREQRLTMLVARHGLQIDGDEARLAQVLANLITNAAKYTEPGGSITIAASREGADVVVKVTDTGIGIAPEMLPVVFDMFVQEHQSIDRSQGGLGLGLAIARNLVTAHGGTVSAHSAGKGLGSEFIVRLPAAPPKVDSPPVLDPAPAPAAVQSLRILVVDDNEDVARMSSLALRRLGHSIRVAHDGPSALRAVRDFIPEVALVDIGLPAMDGHELARHLRKVPGLEQIYLVAVTGYGQDADRDRSLAAGFDLHLVKPVDRARYKAVLDQFTAERAQRR